MYVMVLNIESIKEEDKAKVEDLLKTLGATYSVYDNTWDCYITDELKTSVSVYYDGYSDDLILELTERCIDRAIGDQDELLPSDTLCDFIQGVADEI